MKKDRKKTVFIILFVVPALAAFVFFYAYPILQIIVTSICKWVYTNLSNPEFIPAGERLAN